MNFFMLRGCFVISMYKEELNETVNLSIGAELTHKATITTAADDSLE